jgi:hypothetical protein
MSAIAFFAAFAVDPAALLAGLREHFAQRLPESQRPVADREAEPIHGF